MTRRARLSTVALAAGLCGLPAAAQSQQNNQQTQNQQNQNQNQQQQTLVQPQLSQQGKACVDQLEQVDRQLADLGYGRAGPGGYGVYGTGYGTMTAAPTTGTAEGSGALTRPLRATPRADMYALMRAGYVLARTGHDEACMQVAQTVEQIGNNYEQMVRNDDTDRARMEQWRQTYLADATPVEQLNQPLHVEQIIGSDLRNRRDEDLGDIEDVVIGPDGRIRYAIVSSGGFIGLGEEQVPVPWSKLSVTAAPYRDTFVMDVSQQAFENAPTLDNGQRRQLAEGQGSQRIENFWQDQLNDSQQNRQNQNQQNQ